ncbi:MAG: MBL fold metallo-hydrolase [Chloroflexi bacterium]|nr:MBL fold metallo-hydrolase [Chloroflexota bacterium]
MFEVIFLGTSASAPSIQRGLPALVVLANEYRFLVDCGEGTQRQILKSGIGFRRLDHILLTHSHLDHILGLGGLISTFIRWEEGIEGVKIYGGMATLERVHDLIFDIVVRGAPVPIPIDLIPIEAGDVIVEDKHMKVTAVPVIHRGPGCFGFVFQQHDHRQFNPEKATELGVPNGPERALLVKGEAITLTDGRVITPNDVLGEVVPGAKLVVIGDVGDTDSLRPYVKDADCLVIEATYMEEERRLASEVGHLTTIQAAQLAKDTGVKTLILTHISRRNHDQDVRHEARSVFSSTYVARDFDHYVVARAKPVQKLPPPNRRTDNSSEK